MMNYRDFIKRMQQKMGEIHAADGIEEGLWWDHVLRDKWHINRVCKRTAKWTTCTSVRKVFRATAIWKDATKSAFSTDSNNCIMVRMGFSSEMRRSLQLGKNKGSIWIWEKCVVGWRDFLIITRVEIVSWGGNYLPFKWCWLKQRDLHVSLMARDVSSVTQVRKMELVILCV